MNKQNGDELGLLWFFLTNIFERELNPDRTIKEISAKSGESILKNDMFIIFDQIQSCKRALMSLKYFCENAPQYHIMAAGSFFGSGCKQREILFPCWKG